MLKRKPGEQIAGRRVFTEATSARMRQLLRMIVLSGTGRNADAPAYRVGGKTGTAEKSGKGGYKKKANVQAFTSVFPMNAPRYAVYMMLDEAKGNKSTYGYATAGWVAAPAAGRVINRIAPVLGVRRTGGGVALQFRDASGTAAIASDGRIASSALTVWTRSSQLGGASADGRAYMMLWDKPYAEIAYCLVSTPDDLIGWEAPSLHKVDHINRELRLTLVPYERDLVLEEKIKVKVAAARLYYEFMVREIANQHTF